MHKPEGYTSVSPYLIVDGASQTIEFLKRAFGAIELRRFPDSTGKLNHAEVRIDDTVVMIADGGEGWPPIASHVHVYVSDVDAIYKRALAAGATSVQEPVKKDDADKRGGVKDSGGTTWWIATKVDYRGSGISEAWAMKTGILFLTALSFLILSSDRSVAAAAVPAPLMGTWIQEQMGQVVTHERVYRFSAHGSYVFLFTVRNTGSVARKTLLREIGKFALRGNRLVISPNAGAPRTFPWRIERDPYVGDLRLVLVLPDGMLHVYYRR